MLRGCETSQWQLVFLALASNKRKSPPILAKEEKLKCAKLRGVASIFG